MRTDGNMADVDTVRRNENGMIRSSDVRGGHAFILGEKRLVAIAKERVLISSVGKHLRWF